jgi:hypothetical protein
MIDEMNSLMKIKYLLACIMVMTMLMSCDEFNRQLKPHNPNEDNIGAMVDDGEESDADEEVSTIGMPMTKSFYTNLLDAFCQEHFDENFNGDHYKNGSIVVVKIDQKSDSVVEVSGTHSYKVNLGTEVSGQMYKARVSNRGNNVYNIKFEKGSSKVFSDNSYWDDIEADFTYQ